MNSVRKKQDLIYKLVLKGILSRVDYIAPFFVKASLVTREKNVRITNT